MTRCATQAVVPYMPSNGYNNIGYYEIYLCDNLFDVNYGYQRGVHVGVNQAVERRIADISTAYGYTGAEIKRQVIVDSPVTFQRTYGRNDILRYRVHFHGGGKNLPRITSSVSAYIYSTEPWEINGMNRSIFGDFKRPRFLREGDEIEYVQNKNQGLKSNLYVNLCDYHVLKTFAVAKGSSIVAAGGKITAKKGGFLECTVSPVTDINTQYGENSSCNGELRTVLE